MLQLSKPGMMDNSIPQVSILEHSLTARARGEPIALRTRFTSTGRIRSLLSIDLPPVPGRVIEFDLGVESNSQKNQRPDNDSSSSILQTSPPI
jgi:hypothetical protein